MEEGKLKRKKKKGSTGTANPPKKAQAGFKEKTS